MRNVEPKKEVKLVTGRYDILPWPLKALSLCLTAIGTGACIYFIFGILISGFVFIEGAYYYLIIATFFPSVFLLRPARKKDGGTLPWYDLILAGLASAIPVYFVVHGYQICMMGWIPASTFNIVIAMIFLLLVLEAARRLSGLIFLAVVVIFALYPMVAEHMPGMLFGLSFSPAEAISYYIYGSEGIIGLPTRVIGGLLAGFIIFAGVLIASGGGKFFLNLALAVLGRYRGGPAKVAVLGSGFFGSLSGSIFANIVGTGSFTIPAMKRQGFSPEYAGAIEACASTGGVLMPPVMGSIAFIMCMLLNMPYGDIIIAAAIPAILYYFGLLIQIDAYAARLGFSGLPKAEIPSIKETLKEGWVFILALVFLVWGLVYMRWEAMTPFYASGLLILGSFAKKETMITPRRFIQVLASIGKLLTDTMAVLLPLGIIIATITITGASASMTAALVAMGGENLFLVMIIGVLACYVMGMAGLMSAAYIFLAITLAPGLISMGQLNTLAVHLFIAYYAVLSAFTPPVAVGAFIAASLAGSKPMKTAFTAMRLGVVIYIVPIFFVFNPALILQGNVLESLYLFILCLVGILFIGGGLGGYLIGIGKLGGWVRPLYIISGVLIAFPEWSTTWIGIALAVLVIALSIIRKKSKLENGFS